MNLIRLSTGLVSFLSAILLAFSGDPTITEQAKLIGAVILLATAFLLIGFSFTTTPQEVNKDED
jgi:hypothetical protein